ncbi:hypothetical protein L0663_01425 [Dyadobacter sp. CY107]|uniref:hypothetical protein n=1 Tax=Dyadobacter fanqingshengii TaxID=2906443 RepID=UPI001F2BC0B8|nr:hypothetical protein [Dyadobacter fanqingshengii]MCF2502024.1 hypothetical protein [Dyadobacter fanqingshengii]
MEKSLQNRVLYLFVGIFIITTLGFYPTYLSKFPSFEGLTTAHHFHAFIATLWIIMLITQSFLIRAKQYTLHRLIGKSSYVVMPLLLFSLFLVSRAGYYRNIKVISEADTLAALTNGLPDILFLGTLFTLGMVYRKNPSWHLRFLTSTGLMILGPGLGRFLIVFCGLPFMIAIPVLTFLTTGVALIWMILDIRQKKSAIPMAVFVGMGILAFVIGASNRSAWWQGFAGWVAAHWF